MRTETAVVAALTGWLLLGVPLWLWTMAIDRQSLSHSELVQYARNIDTLVTSTIPVYVVGHSYLPDIAQAAQIVINNALEAQDISGLRFNFLPSDSCSDINDLCIDLGPDESDMLGIPGEGLHMAVRYTLESLGSGRVPDLVADLMFEHIFASEIGEKGNPSVDLPSVVPYSPRYHLTFSVVAEGGGPLDWDADSSVSRLRPLLDELSQYVANFTFDTQIEYFAKPGCDRSSGILSSDDLATFVNLGEWRLASNSPEPTLNFVLYIPLEPLEIADSSTNSFVVPQWGGVVVAPPTSDVQAAADAAMEVFAGQFLSLLGVAHFPQSLELRIRSLGRRMTAKALKATVTSLGSLHRLTQSQPNIPIPSDVQENAEVAVSGIAASLTALRNGDQATALWRAGNAWEAAERAFFDKHMVAQVYFPEQHKLAIYAPFLAPLAVVTLGGWLRMLKERRAAQSKNKPSEPCCDPAEGQSSKLKS